MAHSCKLNGRPARIRRMGKVMLSQVSVYPRGYPFPRSLVPGPFPGVPQSQVLSWEVSLSQPGGTPWPGQDWVPPGQDRTGVPPPPSQTEQQSEYFLGGGQYASCGHAGGLSCDVCFSLEGAEGVCVNIYKLKFLQTHFWNEKKAYLQHVSQSRWFTVSQLFSCPRKWSREPARSQESGTFVTVLLCGQ